MQQYSLGDLALYYVYVCFVIYYDDNFHFLYSRSYKMPPKRKAMTQKRKVKGGETLTLYQRVKENLDDYEIPRFLNVKNRENFKTKWKDKNFYQDRCLIIGDFQGTLLERIIYHCDWEKVIGIPHTTYPTLVKELFGIFNTEIDKPEFSHENQTWVRGKWTQFSRVIIDKYYELNHSHVEPVPEEQDIALVSCFLYVEKLSSHFVHLVFFITR